MYSCSEEGELSSLKLPLQRGIVEYGVICIYSVQQSRERNMSRVEVHSFGYVFTLKRCRVITH